MPNATYPCSPNDETDGLPYFARMCQKIRLMESGELHEDLHANLGIAMDEWTCQFLGVAYSDLREHVLTGKNDTEALSWARENGTTRPDYEQTWWIAFMRGVGFRDRLSTRLDERISESGLDDADGILTMFDYIDADEGKG